MVSILLAAALIAAGSIIMWFAVVRAEPRCTVCRHRTGQHDATGCSVGYVNGGRFKNCRCAWPHGRSPLTQRKLTQDNADGGR